MERWTAPDQAGAVTAGAVEIEGRKRRAQRGVVLWGELRRWGVQMPRWVVLTHLFIHFGRADGRVVAVVAGAVVVRWWCVAVMVMVVVVCEGGSDE